MYISDLRKPWQAWSVFAIWEGPLFAGWVLRSDDFQQAIK